MKIFASFFIGLILGFCIGWFIKSFKKKQKPIIKSVQTPIKKDRFYKARLLLNKIKNGETLPIELAPNILRALKTIATTADWENQIDEETLKNLNGLYNKCLNKNKHSQKEVTTLLESHGFERPDIWEGTEEEYQEALKNDLINEDTVVRIYTMEHYQMSDDGGWEEVE